MPGLHACPAAAPAITYHDAMDLPTRVVRLGDVADLSTLPDALARRAAAMPLPWDIRRDGSIEIASLSSVVRARMPLLACSLPTSNRRIRVHAVPAADPERYVVAAAQDLVAPGDTVGLGVAVGAVRVERQVTALQAARPGDRLFVADADGRTVSVRYAASAR
jgi:hypothetical protein